MPECAHRWRLTMATDGCHTFQNTYKCADCAAGMTVGGERQMLDRGRPTYAQMMANEECERCNALCMGARRKPGVRYMLDPKLGLGWIKVKLHA